MKSKWLGVSTVTLLIFILTSIVYAEEGFLLIRDDILMYETKECIKVKYKKPLYKFTYGIVQKQENDKILIAISGYLLDRNADAVVRHKYDLEGCWGWIAKDSVILFQYEKRTELYDIATRIFLKKYFP